MLLGLLLLLLLAVAWSDKMYLLEVGENQLTTDNNNETVGGDAYSDYNDYRTSGLYFELCIAILIPRGSTGVLAPKF